MDGLSRLYYLTGDERKLIIAALESHKDNAPRDDSESVHEEMCAKLIQRFDS